VASLRSRSRRFSATFFEQFLRGGEIGEQLGGTSFETRKTLRVPVGEVDGLARGFAQHRLGLRGTGPRRLGLTSGRSELLLEDVPPLTFARGGALCVGDVAGSRLDLLLHPLDVGACASEFLT